jgi:uncharacterized protein (TIGR00369 family)
VSEVGGSGFQRLVGYHVERLEPGCAVIALEIGPKHINRGGVAHGGVFATMMDAAMGHAGSYEGEGKPLRPVATLALSTSFLRPAKSGMIRVTARLRHAGRRVFFATAEVTDAEGQVVATGQGTFTYRSGGRGGGGEATEDATTDGS